jgi:hypothetical protein
MQSAERAKDVSSAFIGLHDNLQPTLVWMLVRWYRHGRTVIQHNGPQVKAVVELLMNCHLALATTWKWRF